MVHHFTIRNDLAEGIFKKLKCEEARPVNRRVVLQVNVGDLVRLHWYSRKRLEVRVTSVDHWKMEDM